jgi:serine/threonine protein kinase
MLKYSKLSIIGKGTYGRVFDAKCDNSPESPNVAIKEFICNEESIPATTLREISILKSCDHPNILRILCIQYSEKKDEDEDSPLYMITPLYQYNLKQLYTSHPLSSRLIESITYQLTDGIRYLHCQGIIHRDLKPQNIFLNPIGNGNYVCVIGDFGLARRYYNQMEPLPMTTEIVTLWYRPPEVLLGQNKYTTAIDVWSLGIIIGEMILGKPFLDGDSDIDQLYKIFSLCGTPTEKIWDGLSELPNYTVDIFPKWNSTFNEFFKSFKGSDKEPLIKLLEKILVLDPQKRMNIITLLYDDPFYDNLRVEDASSSNESPITKIFVDNEYWQPIPSTYQLHTMFQNEVAIQPRLKSLQTDINDKMVVIVIDWLVDVSLKFKLTTNTLNRVVILIYDYLQKTKEIISRKNLQLIGTTILCIASKLEEIYSPELRDYVYICDNTITSEELILTEIEISKCLDYKYNCPMAIEFIRIYNCAAGIGSIGHTMCKFLLELCYLNEKIMETTPSMLAACITYKYLLCKKKWQITEPEEDNEFINNEDVPTKCWIPELIHLSRVSSQDIINSKCWNIFNKYLDQTELITKSKQNAVYRKYSVRYFGVAKKIYKDT